MANWSMEEALRMALRLEAEGADIIDIGAESARTNATAKLIGCPSSRVTLRLSTIPPMLVPFQVHMPAK